MNFAIGDKVLWHSRGRIWEHTGTVVGVLPARIELFDLAMEAPYMFMSLPARRHKWRDHISYIIYDEKTRRLYWPRVIGLRRVA